MPRRSGVRLWAAAALLPLCLAAGCASYSDRLARLRPELVQGEFDAALQTIEKTRHGKAELLYHLEKGLVLHYAGRWPESNEAFAEAERLAADLYTRSVSQGVLSLVTSDNTIDYRAEAFEMAMIPYFRAMNYHYLSLMEDAVVEARKASLYLSQYEDPDLRENEDLRDTREILANNAFLQYFSGLFYEAGGEANDAWIAYLHAAAAYRDAGDILDAPAPPWLAADLERTAWYLGFTDELEQTRRDFPALFPAPAAGDGPAAADDPAVADPPTRTGEVVLLLELGFVANKVENKLSLPILTGDDFDDDSRFARELSTRHGETFVLAEGAEVAYWLVAAMPEMAVSPPPVAGARVSAGLAGTHAVSHVVEDVSSRASLTFDSRRGAILLKTIARALVKYHVWKAAEKKDGLAGLLTNVFNVASETADTRSWLTLPDRIAMVRLSLPPGTYDLRVDLTDEHGAVVSTETVPQVVVRSGDWEFISRRVF